MELSSSNHIINPLFNTDGIEAFDDRIGEKVKITKANVSKYYKKLYVICPLSPINIQPLMNLRVNKEEFESIIQKMVLYETTTRILKNSLHFNSVVLSDIDIIEQANKFKYDISDSFLVLPIYSISFLNIKQYLDNFEERKGLDLLYNQLVINDYFLEKKDTYKNNSYIDNLISNIKEGDYWKNYYNCMLNLTQKFNERTFNISRVNEFANKDINELLDSLEKDKIQVNYLEEIFTRKKYTDPSSIINKKGYRLYNIEKEGKYNKADINNLFDCLNKKQRFTLFCKLLVSKSYCHLVINNKYILDMMDKYIKKFSELFQYLFGYTWIKLYMEESIKKSYVKTDDTFIFDIDTASKLPVFPFDINDPSRNPYMPLLVSDHSLQPNNNIGGLLLDHGDINLNHRICNLAEFTNRFNIFCSNKSHVNIFEGFDFKNNKTAISGSIMTACLQYNHPNLKLFRTPSNTTMDDVHNRFFSEYYAESDIDVMVKTQDIFEFIDISKNIYEKVSENICLYYDARSDNVKYNLNKAIYVFVTKDFIMNNIVSGNLTFDIIVTNLNKSNIKELFFKYIEECHIKKIKEEFKDFSVEEIKALKTKYPEYFAFSVDNITIRYKNNKMKDSAIRINMPVQFSQEEIDFIIDKTMEEQYGIIQPTTVIHKDDLGIVFSFKARVSAPQIEHDLEIFPIKGDDFFSVVNNFHLPCVRAYYDGENVYMTPSCISSHLTFMNINYKYVCGTKDPIDIINKYRMRGFGTWLNKKEIKLFISYAVKNKFWNNLYNVSHDNPHTYKNVLGFLDSSHKLFHPRIFNADYYNSKTEIRYIHFEYDQYSDTKDINIKNNSLSLNNFLYHRYQAFNLPEVFKKALAYQNKNTGYLNKLNDKFSELVFDLYTIYDDHHHTNDKITDAIDTQSSSNIGSLPAPHVDLGTLPLPPNNENVSDWGQDSQNDSWGPGNQNDSWGPGNQNDSWGPDNQNNSWGTSP